MQRNLTSHTYEQNLAELVYKYLKEKGVFLFIDLKSSLNEKLSMIMIYGFSVDWLAFCRSVAK